MASSGKKGKKTKGKTLALNDFLQETPGSAPVVPLRKTNLNWVDDVEERLEFETRPKINVVLPTAPKASRGMDEYNDRIPNEPPYIAYLTNLPYDVDEDEIASLFNNLKITNMRFPKEDRGETPRLKGYGYIEFEDRESFASALAISDCMLKNRRVRIEVATNSDNDKQRRGGRNDMNRDRGERTDTGGDWRSGPRTDLPEPERRGGFNRDGGFSRDREGGFSRDREGGFSRDREGGFSRDREGGFSRERDGGSWRDSSDRPTFRDSDRGFGDRGRFGDRDGDRRGFGDRDGERRGFGPRRDRDDRDGFLKGKEEEKAAEPRTRRKLVLAPRSKPLENNSTPEETQPKTSNVPAASIFGAAKPVDTAAREREIESKLAKEYERLSRDSSREKKRDEPRRDWGRKSSPRRSSVERRSPRRSPRRYSPRNYSPRRRSSPRKYSPKRGSPGRYVPKRGSPIRYSPRRGSPDHYSARRTSPGYSPRRRSPSYSPRRGSSGRSSPRDGSPGQSPPRRGTPPRYSPERSMPENRSPYDSPTHSPDGNLSPPLRRNSLDQRRSESPSPDRKSPDQRTGSTERAPLPKKSSEKKGRRGSPDGRKERKRSPVERQKGPADRRKSPDRIKRTSDKTAENAGRKNDEKKNHSPKDKSKKEKREHEMPKLKEPEAPNFAITNKFAFLAEGDDVDISD